jgi:hypothetical protein
VSKRVMMDGAHRSRAAPGSVSVEGRSSVLRLDGGRMTDHDSGNTMRGAAETRPPEPRRERLTTPPSGRRRRRPDRERRSSASNRTATCARRLVDTIRGERIPLRSELAVI